MIAALHDPELALVCTLRCVCMGVLIDAIEKLRCTKLYCDRGALAWSQMRQRRRLFQGPLFAFVFGDRSFRITHALRVFLASLMIVHPGGGTAMTLTVAALFVLGLQTVIRTHPWGIRAADRMTCVILGALTLCLGSGGGPGPSFACCLFLTAQLCISYLTASLARLSAPQWRQGTAVGQLLATEYLGAPAWLGALIQARPIVNRGLTWGTLAFEGLFPLAWLLPTEFALVVVAGGAAFHISVALTWGFNTFVWTWLACYPALLHLVVRSASPGALG